MLIGCSVCGAQAEDTDTDTALTWARDADAHGRLTWVCPDCTRVHVRSIEAKLDQQWW